MKLYESIIKNLKEAEKSKKKLVKESTTISRTEAINKVAEFLKDAVEGLKQSDAANDAGGCYHFNLGPEFALYVGWSSGFDENDPDYIHSIQEPEYCIDAGVKIRNDFDCADFEFLDFPWGKDGDVWDNGLTMKANMTDKDYKDDAKWFIDQYIEMKKAYDKGEILIESENADVDTIMSRYTARNNDYDYVVEKCIEAYNKGDLENAYDAWCKLHDILDSKLNKYPDTDKDSTDNRYALYKEFQDYIDKIPKEAMYEITDYGKEKTYKEMGYYKESEKFNQDFYDNYDGISRTCPMCNAEYIMYVDVDKYNKYMSNRYSASGELIQNIFPNLNPMEREFIKTGYCPNCQKLLFGTNYKSKDIMTPDKVEKYLEKKYRIKEGEAQKMRPYDLYKKCVICKKPFTEYGNNPWPIKEKGQCCNKCNTEKVIPARIAMSYSKKQ